MSTRACYTFIDQHETLHVYKHSDGYPTGAAEFIQAALMFAWPLPRYEADDFAAAFVAANKVHWWLRPALGSFLHGLAKLKQPSSYKDTPMTIPVEVPFHAFGKGPLSQGGGVRLMESGSIYNVAPGDIEYRYEVYPGNDHKLRVRAYTTSFWDNRSPENEKLIIDCLLDHFPKAAAKYEKRKAA